MPERDYVTDPVKIQFAGVVPFDTLYKTMSSWILKRYQYNALKELEHKTIKKAEGKDLALKWQAVRKVTDYVVYVIEIDMVVKDMVQVKRKGSNEKCYKGDFTFTFNGFLMKDYEERWAKSAIMKFMREVSDKYLTGDKFAQYEKELASEIQKLKGEVKAFLNVQKTI